jgi:hypothetical protein
MSAIDGPWKQAMEKYEAALVEFQSATMIVVARLKSGEPIGELDVQREQQARAQLNETRDVVARLDRLRKLVTDL